MRVAANNATIAGFTITRSGNNTVDWNNSGLKSAGIATQGAVTGMTVRDNILTGNRTAIDINNSSGHTIRNNDITFNRTGLLFRNQTDNLTVVENKITNNWTMGILFLDASGGTNSPVQTALNSVFSNNNLSGNWYGQIVDRQSGGSLPTPGTTNLKNFSGNWYGSTAPVVSIANSAEPGYAAQIPVAYGGSATPPGGQPDILGRVGQFRLHTVSQRRDRHRCRDNYGSRNQRLPGRLLDPVGHAARRPE
ncbi:MAG: right-handed parallel beta-helix repeat-containing protein [Anaerolineae bacterium]|nr:MAG: right-handed parallel beta-helix repeat-containing protein [Anaerolineae bacterium]